ncbi:MAG: DeoR family transcriptional regulator [Candidatus Azambacteria bacterium]|nr:DeoR family transcriptional regulator [Candidatus Azambacteria bacterium]
MEDIFNTEFGKKFLALVKASFKVSDLIPDLVLREKIKSQIIEVYKTFLIDSGNQSFSGGGGKYIELLKEIDILDNFFFLAGQLNFVKDNHLRILRNGFLVFKSRIILMLNELPKTSVDLMPAVKKEVVKPEVKLSERQKKILEKFQNKETLKLAEILELFPGVSEKTVRNELNSLIGLKKITRSGIGNGSFYQMFR